MTAAAYIPPPARPPHDPFRLPLDQRAGWRPGKVERIETDRRDGALVLAAAPDAARRLNEANGSFGGLTPPPNVALAADGTLFLLDRAQGRLKRFDPCSCRFEVVPCTGGQGDGPRQLNDPGGIAICGGNLFIADSGNRRLAVYGLHGSTLRGFWQPPDAALARPWQPVDVAFDSRGHVWVADADNGSVHQFTPGGRWVRAIDGLGAVRAIATDCEDRLYAFISSAAAVTLWDPATGRSLGRQTRVNPVADRFAPLPFEVSANGCLDLGNLCRRPSAGATLFDPTGTALSPTSVPAPTTFSLTGTYISQALDSRLYRCQWDRLSIRAAVPAGTRISVHTYSADTELSLEQILDLNQDEWGTDRTVFPTEADPTWDCLIRSEGGRYLWLKLTLLGDGAGTPRIERMVLDYPRISLRRYLPAVFGREPESADFLDRWLAIFDRGFREIEQQLDRQAHLFDPLSAPAEAGQTKAERQDFLDWLASWIGMTLDRHLPLNRRRRLLKEAGKLLCLRGTLTGLRRLLVLYLGLDRPACNQVPPCGPCTTSRIPAWQPPPLILEHFKLRRWLFLGAGRLGEQAELWGHKIVNRTQLSGPATRSNARLGVTQLKTTQDPFRDPFHRYAHKFSVFVPAHYGRSPQRRKALERLIQSEQPAHTAHQLIFVEPRFRIGIQSMIGFDAVIGCYPEGIVLNQSGLGQATVPGPACHGGPSLRVGDQSRIGTTTTLN